MALIREKGLVAERDNAVWFASTLLGDDKDKVLVRGNGIPTYFASDVAYHYNKFFEREFDRVINIWGADHQGHALFMRALVAALGLSEDRLTLIINQLGNAQARRRDGAAFEAHGGHHHAARSDRRSWRRRLPVFFPVKGRREPDGVRS